MSHAHARTTVHGRLLIVTRHRQGWPQAHIAKAMGISRGCVKKWIERYDHAGAPGLADRSSRPHHCPTATSAHVEKTVVDLRRSSRRGREWIADATGVPARTVSRILARHHMPPLATLDPMTGAVILSSKATAVRYERANPGELVHMDVKKIGRIPGGGGWRAHGRGVGAGRDRKTKVGYDYVHSLVDDHSRLASPPQAGGTPSEVLADERGITCAAFLARALGYFSAHGIPDVQRLMTDNAWAYRWSLREVCASYGIAQKFIRPHCPWQNGKVERFNRTLQVEWAYRQVFTTNTARTDALAPWLEHYNTSRRHSALGGRPPTSRLPPT